MNRIVPLNEYPQQPMSEDDFSLLYSLMRLERRGQAELLTEDLESMQMCQLIRKRAEYHGLKINATLNAYLAELSRGVPGRAVQLLHAMAANTQADQDVTLTDFCHIFGEGIPNDDDFIAAWDAQKNDGVNRLDTEAWERKQ